MSHTNLWLSWFFLWFIPNKIGTLLMMNVAELFPQYIPLSQKHKEFTDHLGAIGTHISISKGSKFRLQMMLYYCVNGALKAQLSSTPDDAQLLLRS